MTVTTPLISLAAAKVAVPVRAGNTDLDARIATLLAAASEDIEFHTDRQFTYNAWVQNFDTVLNLNREYDIYGGSFNEFGVVYVPRKQRFILQGYPIDPNIPVVVNYDPSLQFLPGTIIDPSLYIVDYKLGAVFTNFGMGTTMAALQITYNAGYGTDTVNNCLTGISSKLALACTTQVGFLWNKLHPDNVGMDADRTKGAANRANMVQKFVSMSGLCPEAAQFIGYLKPLAMGRF
jgi:hypothetical protein